MIELETAHSPTDEKPIQAGGFTMPAKQNSPTLKEVTHQVLEELTEPTSVNDVVQRVLQRYPSASKHPTRLVRNQLHSREMVGVEIVYPDAGTIAPLRLAMPGVCFRVPLDAEHVQSGLLPVSPGFVPFVTDRFSRTIATEHIEVQDENGQVIANGPTASAAQRQIEPLWPGYGAGGNGAFDLRDWLHAHQAQAGDSLLVTLLNWRPARLRLEFEPQTAYRGEIAAAQNDALADCIQSLLDESYDERIGTNYAILTAYARMPGARGYPGDHWLPVLFEDPRFLISSFDIRASDGISTAEYLSVYLEDAEPGEALAPEEEPITPEQGNQVYRFSAKENYGTRERRIEILGRHTLADFDNIMRTAFRLDRTDHLSEFTRITRRGRKRPHEQRYGEINPFQPTPAMEYQVAGLDLEVGTELEYLYDFGDSLRHTLILQSISAPARNTRYPRVVKP
jgi:hypothetical protein